MAHTSWLGCVINSTLFQPLEYKGPPFHDVISKIDQTILQGSCRQPIQQQNQAPGSSILQQLKA